MQRNPTNARGSSSAKKSRKPRELVLVACNRCQRLKRRCDGARPSCESCRRTNFTCEYATVSPRESRTQAIRRQHDNLQAFRNAANESLDWLRSQPPNAVLLCLDRLRLATDPMQELCSIAAVDRARRPHPEIPPHELLVDPSQMVRDTLTAELVTRCPASFPWLASVGTNLDSRSDPLGLSDPCAPLAKTGASKPGVEKRRERITPALCDSRLNDLKIRFWTTVPISNELAANIISSYLLVEHPVYGFFDPDLFLEDLLARNVQFCSSLLVNAILFWGCCTFSPTYPGASAFANRFLEAAQRLLHAEQYNNTGLAVASLMILTISTICFGKDQLAQTYMKAGIRMGEEMFLFGEKRRPIEQFNSITPVMLSMLSYAAWGAFNLSTVLALHFHDLESGTFTRSPPLLPRPGSIALASTLPPSFRPSSPPSRYLGTTFPFFCGFWVIAHEIASVMYGSTRPLHQHVPLAFVEAKFRRLLEWMDALPPEATRSEKMTHNVVEMHICYHATIMDLFRPFLAQGQLLSTFSTSPRRPETIFMLSLDHLQALTNYYHTAYAGLPESHTISWVHGPLYVAPAILRYKRNKGWEADFVACIEACSDLLQSHRMMEGFLRALLGMAVTAGALSMPQAVEYLDRLRVVRDGDQPSDVPETGFVVDQDLAMESRAAAVGDVLAQRFDDMLFTEDPFELE